MSASAPPKRGSPGSSKALPPDELPGKAEETANYKLYPGLRQLPRLAVPYANLYREVQTQEAVYQLLTQQYELARLEEAKDVPVVSIIDAPGIPEKKSFPPRLLLSLLLTAFAVGVSCAWLLLQSRWQDIPAADPGKALLGEIGLGLRAVIVGTVVWSGSAIRGRLRRTP